MGVSKELLMRRRNLGSPHIATATGAVASFAGNMVAPFKECKCEFTPVQASGTPSPESPLPISGWTGANVVRCGKNLCDGAAYVARLSSGRPFLVSGNEITSPYTTTLEYSGAGFFAPVKAGVTYTLSTDATGANDYVFWGIYATKSGASDVANVLQSGYSLNGNITAQYDGYVLFLKYNIDSTTVTWTYAQCELGSTATTYEPYTGNTYAVDWTDEAGTVYGGYVDTVRGVLVATQVKKAFSQFNWLVTVDSMFQVTVSDADTVRASAFCECFKKGNDYTEFMSNDNTFYKPDSAQFLLHASSYADKTALLAAVGGYGIVYTLATPIEYPLTPQLIKSLKGTNNVFSNLNGNITVQYFKH